MILQGERDVMGKPKEVWATALDPAMLEACIPGCEYLERVDETTYQATMLARVGPVKARFSGMVVIGGRDLTISCRLSGEGSGGVAGFAKSSATIRLAAVDGDCRLA